MKIKSVKHIRKDQTLDLEVDHHLHQFYCNGMLTSNSHSISYTYVSYREYWLKAHYDPEFNVALLNNTSKGKEARGQSVIAQYITEILKKGYKIIPPNINKSQTAFSLSSSDENCMEIVWGLNWVKNLPDTTIKKIIEERENGKYTSLDNFLERIGKKLLNKRALDALTWSGALDEFGDRFDIHEDIFVNFRKDKNYKKEKSTQKKIIQKETDYNMISLTEIGAFAAIKEQVSDIINAEVDPLYEVDAEGSYICVGKIDIVENKKTKTKKDYVRISLRDDSKVLRGIYCWSWKCKNIYGLKKGDMIVAYITNDGKFKNLTNYFSANE